MTHIMILYDGETGKRDDLPSFLKWIQSLNYDVELDNGVKRSYTVTPRLMIPINLRVCEKAKNQLLKDLKIVQSWRENINSLPVEMLDIEPIDMKDIVPRIDKHNWNELKKLWGYDSAKMITNVHIHVIGEIKDETNCYGEESL